MDKKAIIFDMDGLMIDSERMTWEGYQKYCKEAGYEITLSFYETMLGHPMADVRQMMTEKYGTEFPLEEIIEKVHQYLDDRFINEGVPIKPGLIELLEYAQTKNYKMMVATSSDRDRVERILKIAGIDEYFSQIICGNEVERGKPNPDIFLACCKRGNVTPGEAYVIEDSEMGILAAYRAGIDVICVPDMKEPDEEYRRLTMCTVPTLKEVIRKIDGGKNGIKTTSY